MKCDSCLLVLQDSIFLTWHIFGDISADKWRCNYPTHFYETPKLIENAPRVWPESARWASFASIPQVVKSSASTPSTRLHKLAWTRLEVQSLNATIVTLVDCMSYFESWVSLSHEIYLSPLSCSKWAKLDAPSGSFSISLHCSSNHAILLQDELRVVRVSPMI